MLARGMPVHCPYIRDKRRCPDHNTELTKSNGCPVEFSYLHPKNYSDKRRWIGGIVSCQKSATDNLNNHPLHNATKISQCVRERISTAVAANPMLTPSDIAHGQGMGFVPSATDDASCHLGKGRHKQRKVSINDKSWSPFDFEGVADTIYRS